VGVFVCGPQVLSSLKGTCIQQNKLSLMDDKPTATQFVFHKENF